MTDHPHDPIEDLLRRYRPSDPPSSLRSRVVDAGIVDVASTDGAERRAWPWLAAAAALLLMVWGSHGATITLLEAQAVPVVDGRANEVAALAEILGDDIDAQRVAALIVTEEDAARAGATIDGTESRGGQR